MILHLNIIHQVEYCMVHKRISVNMAFKYTTSNINTVVELAD